MKPTRRIAPEKLRDLVAGIFSGRGMSDADAGTVADVLVWAESQGRPGHGVARVARYVEMIEGGELDPRAEPEIVSRTPATLFMDARRAAGPVALKAAAGLAQEAAARNGGCFALVRRATHTGALGYFTTALAEVGFVAIVLAAGKPLMAYHGARVPSLSTSPVSLAVPRADGAAIVLDMATSGVSMGKLKQFALAGSPIPDDWALTQDGRPTTDAAEAAIPLPLGGAKGSGLSLMFELVSGVLAGAPVLAPSLAAGGEAGLGQNAMIMVLDVAAFGPPERFVRDVETLVSQIRALPARDGFEGISLPGDRSGRHARDAAMNGIAVREELLADLEALSRRAV